MFISSSRLFVETSPSPYFCFPAKTRKSSKPRNNHSSHNVSNYKCSTWLVLLAGLVLKNLTGKKIPKLNQPQI